MEDDYRPIEGFTGYRIGKDGEVQTRWLQAGRNSRLTETWRPLSPFPRDGYPSVNLSYGGGKAAYRVHHLVLESFVGPCPQGMVACHNDGDPTNNRIENLRWDTQQANVDDALRHGTRAVGSRCNSKLVEGDVIEIRRLRARGVPARDLASRFGVTANNIWAITSGKSWKHVPLAPDPHGYGAETPQHLGGGEGKAAC